jgi:predicted metal-binding membrane protein
MAAAGSPRRVAGYRVSAIGAATALGLAAAAWVVAVGQMNGMDMGVATRLGSFGFFAALWAWMMAAMMLPGAAPAVARRARAGGLAAVPVFIASYLVVWALVGFAVFALYRPHGTTVAGAVTIAAGLYELTPFKQEFRRRCREASRSGAGFGLCCLGSSIGLMAMLVAFGVMSLLWMASLTIIVTAQKLLPGRAAIDLPVAAAIIGLGIWVILAPASVPWLVPAM